MLGDPPALIRARARLHGRLANQRLLSESVAAALLARARSPGRPLRARLADLLTACRRAESPVLRAELRRQLAPHLTPMGGEAWREMRIGWERYYGDFGSIGESATLPASLLLKAPGENGEKGVLYVSYEYNWMRLFAHHDVRRLLDRYFLVGATSWSPTDYASLVVFAGLSPDPVFVGISNPADVDAYRVLAPVVEPVPIMACDWINPVYYEPKPAAERTIDILMVANMLPFKRHWLLFEALRTMRRDLRVVLVGFEAPGRTREVLLREARAFGVRQDVEILSGRNIAEISALQCDARIATLFSRREGSCVAPAECLFADTPVAMMRDGHVGVKAYVNDRTGVLVERAGLGRALSRFLEERDRYQPRAWATEHITCFHSSDRLNAQLRDYSERAGRPWTRDIMPMCWRYMPTYAREGDRERMASALTALRDEHGIQLVA